MHVAMWCAAILTDFRNTYSGFKVDWRNLKGALSSFSFQISDYKADSWSNWVHCKACLLRFLLLLKIISMCKQFSASSFPIFLLWCQAMINLGYRPAEILYVRGGHRSFRESPIFYEGSLNHWMEIWIEMCKLHCRNLSWEICQRLVHIN